MAPLTGAARLLHYHPRYLSGLIRQSARQSFEALLLDMRLRRAVLYLTSTDYTVSRIVEDQDRGFFYRVFKQQYGVMPLEYRRLNR